MSLDALAESPSSTSGASPCRPAVPDEPVLRLDNIQGNILTGFNKPFQHLVFLQITEIPAFQGWLQENLSSVATAREILAFNTLYKTLRQRRQHGRHLKSLWWNIAFSFEGLQALAPASSEQFTDQAFRDGLLRRSVGLGDPTSGEGSPATWVVGGPNNEAHVLLILAADDDDDLTAECEWIEQGLRGAAILHKERGAAIPGPTGYREHFGFRDGISQPGIRGLISDDPTDVLTLRQNPQDPDQGKPGQELLWPGEFVFGYPRQAVQAAERDGRLTTEGTDSMYSLQRDDLPAVPEWARDGSFLVMRRLRQDVPAFLTFVKSLSQQLGIERELFAAKLVGRFRSGAPLVGTQVDDPALGADDCRNNHFLFAAELPAGGTPAAATADDCLCSPATPFPSDPKGQVCPFTAHIRKANLRDDSGRFGRDSDPGHTLTHRLLRRGIPYGPFYSAFDPFPSDDIDRGLLFLAYQTSIENQFEFVQKTWANNPHDRQEEFGFDPIIGQTNAGVVRSFSLGKTQWGDGLKIESPGPPWVIPSGGGYFFTPPLDTLESLARGLIA